jgi:hypothetical protein
LVRLWFTNVVRNWFISSYYFRFTERRPKTT